MPLAPRAGGKEVVNGGGRAAAPAIGQRQDERTAERLPVEPTLGMGVQSQPADRLPDVQRFLFLPTSALGDGTAPSGAPHGSLSSICDQ